MVAPSPTSQHPAPGIVGRAAERRRLDAFANQVGAPGRSLVLVGEAGIGKTTLWHFGVERCRTAGVQVLVARPTQDDRDNPGQGLRDLFRLHRSVPDPTEDLPVVERSRWVLERLRTLLTDGPVVIAVDDLPWLDDITWRTLRFALRRLGDDPVALLATARTWSPAELAVAAPGLDGRVETLDLEGLAPTSLRRIVAAAVPALDPPAAYRLGDLAHGNPFFALELARAHRHGTGAPPQGSPLAVLAGR
ncbi:AAA family ATPase, partial [uncultured Cellulomonas sp.]|uniref:AAA family ATPase n=1 Tax=uncultured Cellulomonas sp. TaxID=189682 RepID=UPI0028E62921